MGTRGRRSHKRRRLVPRRCRKNGRPRHARRRRVRRAKSKRAALQARRSAPPHPFEGAHMKPGPKSMAGSGSKSVTISGPGNRPVQILIANSATPRSGLDCLREPTCCRNAAGQREKWGYGAGRDENRQLCNLLVSLQVRDLIEICRSHNRRFEVPSAPRLNPRDSNGFRGFFRACCQFAATLSSVRRVSRGSRDRDLVRARVQQSGREFTVVLLLATGHAEHRHMATEAVP